MIISFWLRSTKFTERKKKENHINSNFSKIILLSNKTLNQIPNKFHPSCNLIIIAQWSLLSITGCVKPMSIIRQKHFEVHNNVINLVYSLDTITTFLKTFLRKRKIVCCHCKIQESHHMAFD